MNDVVTIVWPSRGGRSGTISLEWCSGKKLKHYLLDPRIRCYGVGSMVRTCRIYNSKKQRVKSSYTPESGDAIIFIPTR